jgi:phage protein D
MSTGRNPGPKSLQDTASVFAILTKRRRRKDKGEQINPERVLRIRFKDTSKRSSNRLVITLDNYDGLIYGDDLLMRKGTLIGFRFGYPSSDRDAGDFVIKKRKPNGTAIDLECHEAKRNKHSRKPQNRTWTDVRRSDVARHLLSRMGFSGSNLHVDDSELVLPHITQYKIADYQFLEDLADEEGKEFWFDDDGAHWEEPKRNQKPKNRYRYRKGLIGIGNVIGDPEIEDFSSHVPGRIRVRGIDPKTGEEYVVSASDSDDPQEKVKNLIKLASTDAFLTPEEGDQDASGNDGFEIEENIGARSKEEAKTAVDTLYKKYRYGGLKVKVPIIGDPFVFPRTIAELWGLGAAVDGYFWVKEVEHDLKPGQIYKTMVSLNKDGLNKKKGRGKTKHQSTYWQDDVHAQPLHITPGKGGLA